MKNSKGFVRVGLIITLVILLGGVAVYFVSQSKKDNTTLLNQTNVTDEKNGDLNHTVPGRSNQAADQSVVSMQKYTSNEYNYEIQHPADWTVSFEAIGVDPVHKFSGPEGSVYVLPKGTEIPSVRMLGVSEDGKEFYTQAGAVFAFRIRFTETPASWASFGSIYGSAKLENVIEQEPVGMSIPISASVKAGDVEVIQRILSSFRFVGTNR